MTNCFTVFARQLVFPMQVLELQPIGKKAMSASAFINGLKGRKLYF